MRDDEHKTCLFAVQLERNKSMWLIFGQSGGRYVLDRNFML
ncbi:hypothetical protein VOA_000823 [Vibrio sp. RC586]|nr:hypothetical protein VOA_000823 [Vibrio sp. RC586]